MSSATPLGECRAQRILIAAILYFSFAIVLGFVLGAVRVLFLVPLIGAFQAVALELPIMLIATWLACTRIVSRTHVPPRLFDRLLMGGFALALLLTAEFCIAALLQSRTMLQFLQELASAHGLLGLSGQILFALFPAFQAFERPR